MSSDGKASICHRKISVRIATNENMVTHPRVARGEALGTLLESPCIVFANFRCTCSNSDISLSLMGTILSPYSIFGTATFQYIWDITDGGMGMCSLSRPPGCTNHPFCMANPFIYTKVFSSFRCSQLYPHMLARVHIFQYCFPGIYQDFRAAVFSKHHDNIFSFTEDKLPFLAIIICNIYEFVQSIFLQSTKCNVVSICGTRINTTQIYTKSITS